MGPPPKRRKIETIAVEEITFDTAARQEYLTGFHKRKLQRAKHAQEIAEKKARAERVEGRRKVGCEQWKLYDLTAYDSKKLREERRADLDRHIQEVNSLLKPEPDSDSSTESDGQTASTDDGDGEPEASVIDHEAEYINEGRYMTVTVEELDVSKEGLYKAEKAFENHEGGNRIQRDDNDLVDTGDKPTAKWKGKRTWTKERPNDKPDRPRTKRKKFRYESKAERKTTRTKEKLKNRTQARARRSG